MINRNILNTFQGKRNLLSKIKRVIILQSICITLNNSLTPHLEIQRSRRLVYGEKLFETLISEIDQINNKRKTTKISLVDNQESDLFETNINSFLELNQPKCIFRFHKSIDPQESYTDNSIYIGGENLNWEEEATLYSD